MVGFKARAGKLPSTHATSGPLPVFDNKVLLAHNHSHYIKICKYLHIMYIFVVKIHIMAASTLQWQS